MIIVKIFDLTINTLFRFLSRFASPMMTQILIEQDKKYSAIALIVPILI